MKSDQTSRSLDSRRKIIDKSFGGEQFYEAAQLSKMRYPIPSVAGLAAQLGRTDICDNEHSLIVLCLLAKRDFFWRAQDLDS